MDNDSPQGRQAFGYKFHYKVRLTTILSDEAGVVSQFLPCNPFRQGGVYSSMFTIQVRHEGFSFLGSDDGADRI